MKGGWGINGEGTAGETGESRCEGGGEPVKTRQLPEWIWETPDAQVSGSGDGGGCGLRGASREDTALPMQGALVQSPVRELDPTRCN